jgi:uncharacterized repeat protein (TIGR01451 family)
VKALNLYLLLIIGILFIVPVDGNCAIALDGTSSAHDTNASSLTWSHTVTSNSRGILIVGIAMNPASTTVGSVTYNGVALTYIGSRQNLLAARVEIWYLLAPPTGAHNVVVTLSGGDSVLLFTAGASSFTGVNQTTPFYGGFTSNTGLLLPATVTVPTSSASQVVVDAVALAGLNLLVAPGAEQTILWREISNVLLTFLVGSGSYAAGTGGNVTMAWGSLLSVDWASGAIVLNQAPPYLPDAMIKNNGEADAAYLTANVYETTASAQAKAQAVVNNTAATYILKFVNNGASTDDIKVTGTASGSGFTVEYWEGATDRTAAVTGLGAYTIVPSDGSMVLTLKVTPGASVAGGSSYPVFVTATSVGDGTKTDQVKATTTSNSPLLTLVKSADKASYKPGDDITYTVTATNGSGLSSAASVFVTDPIPASTGFKVGGASFNAGTSTLTAAYSYSNNGGTTYAYTPSSGNCSAPAGYDYCVTNVQWTMTGSMPTGTSFTIGLVVQVK